MINPMYCVRNLPCKIKLKDFVTSVGVCLAPDATYIDWKMNNPVVLNEQTVIIIPQTSFTKHIRYEYMNYMLGVLNDHEKRQLSYMEIKSLDENSKLRKKYIFDAITNEIYYKVHNNKKKLMYYKI